MIYLEYKQLKRHEIMACENQISTEDLINAKSDAVTLGEVATSRTGAESGGAPITQSTNRFGETTDTLQGRLNKLGILYDDPIRDWSASLLVSDLRAHRYPATTGDIYIPSKPLPFTTGGAFDVADWILIQQIDVEHNFTSISNMVAYTEHEVDNIYTVVSSTATYNYVVALTGDIALFGGLFAKRNSKFATYGGVTDMVGDLNVSIGDSTTFQASSGMPRAGVNEYKISSTTGIADGENVITVQNGFQALQNISVSDGEKRSMMVRANMHFGALKGMPWASGELGASQTYTLSSDANVNDMSINLVNATGIVPNQLLCYQSEFGNYHSFVAKGRIGNLVELRSPIEEFLSSSGEVYNFYTNSSHPNSRGNSTIADYALRDLSLKRELVNESFPVDLLTLASSSISLFSINDKFKPGGALNEFATITCPSVGDGCLSEYIELSPGTYEARITISPGSGLSGASSSEIQLLIDQDRGGQLTSISSFNLIGDECSRTIGLRFNAAKNSLYRVKVISQVNINTTFSISHIEFLKITDNQYSVNTGRHILFGDSWFVFGGFYERLIERLPNALIINKGVGGNTSFDLIARYGTDVVPEKPDFMWLTCGTNDYGASNSLNVFDNNMNILRSNNVGNGITTITIDPSVGDTAAGTNFELSRSYSIGGSYDDASQAKTTPFTRESDQYSSGWSLDAGASVVVASSRNTVTSLCELDSSYFIGAAGIDLTVGYATNLVAASEDAVIYGAETIQSTPIKLPKSTSTPRYLTATLTNTTGSPIVISGFVKLKWN